MPQKDKKGGFRTSIGGQAIIEGIMMLGPEKAAIVVNTPQGRQAKELRVKRTKDRFPVLGLPFIRGMFSFFDTLRVGVRALFFSADFFPEDEEKGRFELWLEKKLSKEKAEKIGMGIALVLGILLPIGLFILLPAFIAGLVSAKTGSGFVRSLLEGIIRIVIFLTYIILVSRVKEMKRVFSYHGAEHKAVHCYESGEELTVENVRKFPRQHPRCGTSFLFVVMIVSILVFSFVTWPDPFVRMLLRLVFLPVVVGISYEINKFAGRYDNALTRFLRAPGIWLQNFTTSEPDDLMMEVAVDALRRVIPEEKDLDRW
jgi:uncharacterized protein YqhQ